MRRQSQTVALVLIIIVAGVIVLRSASSQSLTQSSTSSKQLQDESAFSGIGTCSNLHAFTSEKATLLASVFNDDLTSSRVRFGGAGKYNPNLLPLPASSKHQYLGVVRSGQDTIHDVQWCFMRWKKVPITERKVVECTTELKTLDNPHFRPTTGTCKKWDWLEVDQGFLDPRVLFSPFGEPLMVVGSNSHEHCLGMYVIDLRVLIPELGREMQLDHVPIRFDRYYELDSPAPEEISKNWFFLWDLENQEYIHHNLKPQSVTSIQDPSVNIADSDQGCISTVEHDNIHLHQATNALRLTLCNFPCVPTADNTVLLSIAHIKRIRRMDILYERYLVVMNATAPFDIIARSKNLVFAGMDESQMIYTVSMAWDTTVRTRHSWSDHLKASRRLQSRSEEVASLRRLVRREDFGHGTNLESPPAEPEAQVGLPPAAPVPDADAPAAKTEPDYKAGKGPAKPQSEAAWARIQELPHTLLSEMPLQVPRHPIVTDFFHGWLDDVVMINFGIRDTESSVIHVGARDLVNCLVDCRVPVKSTR
ncbi:hypothetical protein POJ06DRAFT_58831 [Lipomyces tetrasporus]|uniref:Uncharacterized protein n=1 Tax=Lipomyces tetrasporus TaxID=54092 RepID=A0AAD7QWR1_9ASCO|nr:uncharacterized protein POJ06DRAFT_58831 [Lipomyces tetrasporus]KAJ8102913.1 hypothetical protein POJ06DRAFT_58831 [Lipomyces tetrasporus]